MHYVVFDLETQNTFEDTGMSDPASLSISVGSFFSSADGTYTTLAVDELSRAWPLIEGADALVGYNSNYFDIPLLDKYYPGDLHAVKSLDLLESIRASLGRRLRLDSVAAATVGARKSASGAQAVRWWQEGNIDAIKQYCEQDVKVTKEVFEYAHKHGHVKFKDGVHTRQIPLDTSLWDTKESGALTRSLPF